MLLSVLAIVGSVALQYHTNLPTTALWIALIPALSSGGDVSTTLVWTFSHIQLLELVLVYVVAWLVVGVGARIVPLVHTLGRSSPGSVYRNPTSVLFPHTFHLSSL